MGHCINVDIKSKISVIPLTIINTKSVELDFKPTAHEMTVNITDFPSFKKIALSENIGLINDGIGFNIISERLITNADFILASEIDSMILADIDIDQNEIVYNV